jgi:hypothetical protein
MSEVTLERLESEFNNKYRENFETSLTEAINLSGVVVTRKAKDKEIRYMQMYMNGEVSHEELQLAISRVGEKTACMIFCNGNLSEFNDWKKDLKAIADDLEKAEQGFSGRHVTVEEGKAFQDHEKGTHAPSHATHNNNGLGENAGFVGRFNKGYVWRLFADGTVRDLNEEDVKMLLLERYEMIPSSYEAKMIATKLNKERRVLEGLLLQGDIGDSPTTKDAISIITNEGKKKGLAYDKTDQMGRLARKKCAKYDHEIGKIVGKVSIEGSSLEIEKKYSTHVSKFIAENNLNADNVVELILRAIPKFKRS